jgi:hypothetical protein
VNEPVLISIDLDMSMDEGETADDLKEKWPGIDFEVVNPFGPGGGNPIVRLTGTKEALADWLRENYESGDPEHDQRLIDSLDEGGWVDQAARR